MSDYKFLNITNLRGNSRLSLILVIISLLILILNLILWIIERIRLTIFAFSIKDKTSAVLLLVGFLFDIIGIVGLFILKKQVKQLILSKLDENQNKEDQIESNNDFGRWKIWIKK